MQYPSYVAQGWPIGSGAVESGNKLVVEARLKGAGMHWARTHVNPMVALRCALCSDRWPEAHPQILAYLQQQAKDTRQMRRQKQLAQLTPTPESAETPSCIRVSEPVVEIRPPQDDASGDTPLLASSDLPAPQKPWRPAPDHPWRHSPIGKARYRQRSLDPPAKN